MVCNNVNSNMGEQLKTDNYELYNDDCISIMKTFKDKSIDLILCDLPYGIFGKDTAKWDKALDSKILFDEYNRIIKDTGNIVLFGSGLFTAELMLANKKYYRYNLIWKKGEKITAPMLCNKQPLRNHEDIIVFYKTGKATYNPQLEYVNRLVNKGGGQDGNLYRTCKRLDRTNTNYLYPKSILNYNKDFETINKHPTQKPIKLLEYLIKTYSNKNDIVLDNTMGSGSCGVACRKTKRYFIGIELDKNFFKTAKDWITFENDKVDILADYADVL